MNKIIKNLKYEEYDKMEGVSNSKLSKLAISPAHYKESLETPQKQTEALTFGSLLHCLVLEPQNYARDFAIEPEVNRRTNDGKEILAEFYETNSGKTILTENQFELASILKENIFAHPIANKLLSGKGENEISLFWEDEETKVKCKAKLDRIKSDIIIDLKSARSAKPEDFARQLYDLGYYRQCVFYLNGFKECYQKEAKGFVFIVVEKEPPYNVVVYELSELFKEIGKIEISDLLQVYKECIETNNFYGYDGTEPKIHTLDPPKWVLNKYFEDLGIEREEVIFND